MKFPYNPFRHLLSGFDTIQAAYYFVPTHQGSFAYEPLVLERERLRASKSREGAMVTVGGWRFRLKPHGSGSGYPLVLEHPDYTLECGEFNSPAFFVTFRSEALWRIGVETLHRNLLAWSESAGLREARPSSVSRVDFAFDYWMPHIQLGEGDVLSLAAKDAKYREDGRVQTLSYGKGDVMLRIYDKVVEIAQQSDKVWLFQLWGEMEGVWRIEWQIRKPVLRRFGLRSFSDLFNGYGDALRYLATEHDSLRTPTSDSNKSRWPLHPLWVDLVGRIESFPAQGIYREIDEQAVLAERQQRIAISVYGYLKHFAALIGATQERTVPLREAESTLHALIERLHDPLSWKIDVAKKREQIRLGR